MIGIHTVEMPAPFLRQGLAGGMAASLAGFGNDLPALPPVPGADINTHLTESAAAAPPISTAGRVLWGLLHAASVGVSVYHGTKRNDSIGWGLWWGLMGAMFPIVTPAVAVAQGLGERKK